MIAVVDGETVATIEKLCVPETINSNTCQRQWAARVIVKHITVCHRTSPLLCHCPPNDNAETPVQR